MAGTVPRRIGKLEQVLPCHAVLPVDEETIDRQVLEQIAGVRRRMDESRLMFQGLMGFTESWPSVEPADAVATVIAGLRATDKCERKAKR